MPSTSTTHHDLALSLAAAWNRLERSLDGALSGVRGVSFAEYRILRALADAPAGSASRVDLASAVGLTPSGVTRALRPLEKLRILDTVRSERDARLALATLTEAGRELVDDCAAVVEDVVGSLLGRVTADPPNLADLLEELARP